MPFEYRRCALENCKYVDIVVAHAGDAKAIAWQKLKFDILFSGDDYFDSKEFDDFKAVCPTIPIRFFPKDDENSSTAIISKLMQRFNDSQKIIAPGVSGYVIRQGLGPFQIVKPLHFAQRECDMQSTADHFGFFTHFTELPRNWKSPHHTQPLVPTFPMISGINPNREIVINILLKKKHWCTYLSHSVAYDVSTSTKVDNIEEKFDSLTEFANHVAHSRKFPAKIVHLVQRDAGITFNDWCKNECISVDCFKLKVQRVEEIIEELQEAKIVHGDIHPYNILIDARGFISIIDFGWACSSSFKLNKNEELFLNTMLEHGFDHEHFHRSMQVCPATKLWLQASVQL